MYHNQKEGIPSPPSPSWFKANPDSIKLSERFPHLSVQQAAPPETGCGRSVLSGTIWKAWGSSPSIILHSSSLQPSLVETWVKKVDLMVQLWLRASSSMEKPALLSFSRPWNAGADIATTFQCASLTTWVKNLCQTGSFEKSEPQSIQHTHSNPKNNQLLGGPC